MEAAAYYKQRYGTIELHPSHASSTRKCDFKTEIRGQDVFFEAKSPQLSEEEKKLYPLIQNKIGNIPDFSENIREIILESQGVGNLSRDPQLPAGEPGIFIVDLRYCWGKWDSDVEDAFLGPKGMFSLGGPHICAVVYLEDSWEGRKVLLNPQRDLKFGLADTDF